MTAIEISDYCQVHHLVAATPVSPFRFGFAGYLLRRGGKDAISGYRP